MKKEYYIFSLILLFLLSSAGQVLAECSYTVKTDFGFERRGGDEICPQETENEGDQKYVDISSYKYQSQAVKENNPESDQSNQEHYNSVSSLPVENY